MEVPAEGLREIRLTGNAGLRRVVWTQGATPFADACGLQDIALFWPADQMSATPGGGVSADLPASVAGIVAAAGSGPAHCTWWQQTNVDTTYSSRISSVLSSGAITIPADAEAGPPPAMEGPAAWVPREMDWEPLPGSLYWILEGKVSIANIRITRPPEVTLESALELPPGVSVSPAAPGTAVGFKHGPAAGGDAVALRDGPRALALTAEGPGILSLDRLIWTGVNAPAAPLKIAVDAYPALDFSGKRGHLLLGSGLHTIFLGCAQIFNAACRLDNLAFLPLSFDPLQALGANIPILVTGNGEPAAWPFVSTRGTAGFPLPAGSSLLVSSPGPAFFSFEAAAEIRVSYPFASPPPVQVWPLGSPAVWLDRAATLSFNSGAAGSSSVSGIRMTPLNAGASISLPEALDAGELSITASPGLLPHRNAGLSVIGGDAAAFAAGTPARYLETKVTGPGRVRFWWRARGAALNAISFKINGTLSSGYSQYLWKLMDLPVTAGVKTLRWSVDDAATSAEMDGLQWFPEWSFAAWSAQNVLSSIPSAATRAASDSDHDGVSGLLEFAFGLDPAAPDHHYGSGLLAGPENGRGLPLLQPVTGADGLRYLAFDFPRRINAGITYQMQAANAAVGAWQNTGTLEVLRPLGPDWEMCRFSDSLPVSASRPLRFVRLKVSQP